MITQIPLSKKYEQKQAAREALAAESYDFAKIAVHFDKQLANIPKFPLGMIDNKLKQGKDLTFEEAFVGMCYVLAATNGFFLNAMLDTFKEATGGPMDHISAVAKGTSFLQAMAMKESLGFLTPAEIAGMAAAGSMDLVAKIKSCDRIMETCGMGGDRGFRRNKGEQLKTINASTLSAIVLSSLEIPVMKHGSYGNTTKIGSTEAMELFGAELNHGSIATIEEIFKRTEFCFSDAHLFKTLHDLSHALNHETVNHVIGPMTPPIAHSVGLCKTMGVNEKVHPADIARAYAILNGRGLRKINNVIVFTGLDQQMMDIDPSDRRVIKTNSFLDELSPHTSCVAVVKWGKFFGNFLIRPADFGTRIDPNEIMFKNDAKTLQKANEAALRGEHQTSAEYLAMNAALGLFAWEHLENHNDAVTTKEGLNREMLTDAHRRCLESIMSGTAWKKLQEYVEATQAA